MKRNEQLMENKLFSQGAIAGERWAMASVRAGVLTTAYCLAKAIRDAQAKDHVSQYVLLDLLIGILSKESGAHIDEEIKP